MNVAFNNSMSSDALTNACRNRQFKPVPTTSFGLTNDKTKENVERLQRIFHVDELARLHGRVQAVMNNA